MSERLHDLDLPIWSIIDFFLDLPAAILLVGAVTGAVFALLSLAP